MSLWIFLGLVTFVVAVFAIGWHLSQPGYKGKKSDHFDGKQFINPKNVKGGEWLSALKWSLRRNPGPWIKDYEVYTGPKPVESSQELRVTFINHSTFLIQWNELNVLTDPIWSNRCSPFRFIGPRRMRPPGIHFEDLPPIDIVLISHNHYDHLDISTVKRIEARFKSLFVVPLGVKAHLSANGIKNIIEMDWWQEAESGIKIKALPAQHFSGRGIFDRDKTLWQGYLLEVEGKKLYFVGDTGYGDFFREIGKKEGPIDISLIPIGAYLPKWFMSPIHISPQEAIQVHLDIRSKQSIAMHFGTFPLADEGQGKAEEDLILALDRMNVNQKKFIIPNEGEAMRF